MKNRLLVGENHFIWYPQQGVTQIGQLLRSPFVLLTNLRIVVNLAVEFDD